MALVTKNFSDIITFSRTGSTATYFNSAGVLTSAAADTPRFDYDPLTLAARGLLIEETRTNSIRNNTMVGAVAGTPGTLPQVSGLTSWNVSNLGTLTQQVVGTSTSNGVSYIDLKFSGTTSTTQLSIRFEPGGTGAITASNGQTWSMSLWSAVVAGGLTNISSTGFGTLIYDAAGAFIGAPFSSGVITTTSTLTRTQASGTIATAGTAFIQPQIFVGFASGVAIDITLRIGLPQLELGAFATSVIPTTTTALTRSADVAAVNTLAPWYNATEGTLYGEITDAAIAVGGVSRRIANINDGTEADRITIGWAGATSVAAAFVTDNSVAQAGFTSPAGAYPFPTKVALAYKAADFQAAVNGSAFATVSSGTVPTVNRMTIGDVVTGTTGAQNINGHVRRITYYPRRLSQAELAAITA
jgi:hypothetical protein